MSPKRTRDFSPDVINPGCCEPTLWPGPASQCPFWNLTQPGPALLGQTLHCPIPLGRATAQTAVTESIPTQLGNSPNTAGAGPPAGVGVCLRARGLSKEAALRRQALPFTSARGGRGIAGSIHASSSMVAVAWLPPFPSLKGTRTLCLPALHVGHLCDPGCCHYRPGFAVSSCPSEGVRDAVRRV